MQMRLYFIICFDVSSARLRRRICNNLLAFGKRVQESVFEVSLPDAASFMRLKRDLNMLAANDSGGTVNIRFYYANAVTLAKSGTLDDLPVCQFPSAIVL
jgi:CRISPR-associated endonuclease Cas2